MHVLWDGDDDSMTSHWQHLELVTGAEKTTCYAMLAAIAQGSKLQHEHSDKSLPWPKTFFDALLRSDWRDWVAATKKEVQGWLDNNAFTEVWTSAMEAGAAIIPLGELYSIKRCGRYKFRQIAYGNLLSKFLGDYGNTFSTTVSADGLRWFMSLACACNKRIKGWDATTGYLQAEQRTPLYAYKPTHADFSGLSYEQIAELRQNLLKMVCT